VVEKPRLFLGEDNYSAGSVCETFKQCDHLLSGVDNDPHPIGGPENRRFRS
jgi:hypothetical protein